MKTLLEKKDNKGVFDQVDIKIYDMFQLIKIGWH